MRGLRIAVAAMAMLLVSAAPALAVGRSGVVTDGSISGNVTVEGGGAPTCGVWVAAYDATTGDWISEAPMAVDGAYRITGLPGGTGYKVLFDPECEEYLNEYYDDKADWSGAEVVQVVAGEDSPGIDALLEPAGSISGTVSVPGGGAPLCGVSITASGVSYTSGYTEPDGTYLLGGLRPGSYKVHFQPCAEYAEEWYDDKGDESYANGVTVVGGEDSPGVDAVLETSGTISGTVSSPDGGVPICDVWVEAYSSSSGTWVSSTTTDLDGSYTLGGLRGGNRYAVSFYPSCVDYAVEWYDDKPDRSLADPVLVTTGEDLPGIDAQLETAGSISGTVTVAGGGAPVCDVWVWAASASTGEWLGQTWVETDGTYAIEGLRGGSYLVYFEPDCATYAGEWFDDASLGSQASPVVVLIGDDTPGIDAELESARTISGTVTVAGGGAPSCGVIVGAYDPATGELVSGAETASDGSYVIEGLRAGNYAVSYSPSCPDYAVEWFNDKGDRSQANAVPVTAVADATDIDALLEAGGSIAGTVTVAGGGAPPCDVNVIARDAATGDIVAGTWTATDGTYSIGALRGGSSYTVEFDPTCPEYRTEWYDNEPDSSQAEAVAVVAGEETGNIDALLEEAGKPTDIVLSNESVAERQSAGTTVGILTTTDSDSVSFIYSLVSGEGDTGNGAFGVSGDQLRTAAILDFETQGSFSIRVRTTDGDGFWYEEAFTVTVTDANDPPTDLALSPSSVLENEPSGTTVGSFTTTDQDAGETFTYTLVTGTGDADNGSFTISGDELLTADSFDFETKASYAIRVRTTDGGGLWYEEAFTVAVINDPADDTDPSAFANIATRGKVLTGANILIGGITVAGSSPTTFIFRGQGPSLTAYGVPGALANPVIRVYSGPTMIATNDDWGALSPADRATLAAEGLTPNHPRDSALVLTLNPGPYTLHLLGQNKGTGVGLVEVYETSLWGPVTSPDEGGMLVGDERVLELQGYKRGSGVQAVELREPVTVPVAPPPGGELVMAASLTDGLSNIATRGKVLTGADVMIAGFTIVGEDPKTVVIRGIGPSLAAYGVPGALANPKLQVYSGPTVIATNDNWTSLNVTDKAVLTDLSLTPVHSLEAAVVLTLQPGSYTAILSGVNKGTGVGLVEVYDADKWGN
jgi:hypothetical protein